MAEQLLRRRLQPILQTPAVASALVAILVFCICLGLLHPRYAINDDIKMIAIAAGYPSTTPAPFLVFSNVLLGLALVPLYALHTTWNWEVLVFLLVDLLSAWAVLYVFFSAAVENRARLQGAILIAVCTSYFPLNITFTNVAGFAVFAGLCLLFASLRGAERNKTAALAGLCLVFVGSLIRIQMLALTLPIILAAIPFLYRPPKLWYLLAALLVTGAAVFAGYAFDRLFVRAHPDWNYYYFYNNTAQQLQDTHRLQNTGKTILRISWTKNDQELFARSFFPDAETYTPERIRYLIDHVPSTGQDPVSSAGVFFERLIHPPMLAMALLAAAAWLLGLAQSSSRRKALALTAILVVSLMENAGLVWIYKNPDYAFLSSLACTAILEILVLSWPGLSHPAEPDGWQRDRSRRAAYIGSLVLGIAAVGATLTQSVIISNEAFYKQTLYQQVLADLRQMQSEGELASDALIVSPAHGVPWEWSNPVRLGFPEIAFFDTGWTTFSPWYDEVLQDHGITSLPDALYQKSNVYIMSNTLFQQYLERYYLEHKQLTVRFQPLYAMPSTSPLPIYGNVVLYKVLVVK